MTQVTKQGNKIIIDMDLAKKLSYLQCTYEEIASVMGISVKTLKRSKEFREIHAEGREHGKSSLRRLQWDKAKGREAVFERDAKGNIVLDGKGHPIVAQAGSIPDSLMQIWLGKQYLGQTDKREDTHKGTVGIKIVSAIPRPQRIQPVQSASERALSVQDVTGLAVVPVDTPPPVSLPCQKETDSAGS